MEKQFTHFKNHNAMKSPKLPIVFMMILMILETSTSSAFCGFYVAKADATLFNNKSEVILVRDGNRNVITMSNDFKGDVKDFAMVVPVPVVLQKDQIKVVRRDIFEYLDAYSAPRLVEYYDYNPCQSMVMECDKSVSMSLNSVESTTSLKESNRSMGVKIEARYLVGEYEILLLSAKESTGLKNWLILNGYKIPETAAEVLDPYIKSNMKFFVAKVNMQKFKSGGYDYLSPIQISFESPKFMLPIRLGMANSQGSQDMIVYAFTKSGRVESTNYRTTKMPSDRNIPLFVRDEFGSFYKKVFQKSWKNEGRNAIHLEYAWDVTPNWGMKCDPCVGPPPYQQEFADAGVWWANNPGERIFFTRMHVRYEKAKFPADLVFQITPNSEHYQARYVLTNPASGDFDCEEGQNYIAQLSSKRKLETDEYYALTGQYHSKSYSYINEFKKHLKSTTKQNEVPPSTIQQPTPWKKIILVCILIVFAVGGSTFQYVLLKRRTA